MTEQKENSSIVVVKYDSENNQSVVLTNTDKNSSAIGNNSEQLNKNDIRNIFRIVKSVFRSVFDKNNFLLGKKLFYSFMNSDKKSIRVQEDFSNWDIRFQNNGGKYGFWTSIQKSKNGFEIVERTTAEINYCDSCGSFYSDCESDIDFHSECKNQEIILPDLKTKSENLISDFFDLISDSDFSTEIDDIDDSEIDDKLVQELTNYLKSLIPEMEIVVGDYGEKYKSVFLFSNCGNCGKYHHEISPNDLKQECITYMNSLEQAAEISGGYIDSFVDDNFFCIEIDTEISE